jgi:hypothetical protein
VTSARRQERIARNETRFRDINERLKEGLRRVPHRPDLLEFICECGDRGCEAHVRLTLPEYEAVREHSRRFAVVPGHVIPDAERLVEQHERYDVVEKTGHAVAIADAADPRAH